MGVSPSHLFIGSGGSALLNPLQIDYSPDRIFVFLSQYPDFWESPISNRAEENHEAS